MKSVLDRIGSFVIVLIIMGSLATATFFHYRNLELLGDMEKITDDCITFETFEYAGKVFLCKYSGESDTLIRKQLMYDALLNNTTNYKEPKTPFKTNPEEKTKL